MSSDLFVPLPEKDADLASPQLLRPQPPKRQQDDVGSDLFVPLSDKVSAPADQHGARANAQHLAERDPGQEAEVLDLAEGLNRPPVAVREDLDRSRQAANLREFRQRVGLNPGLARTMADPEIAGLALDDQEALEANEAVHGSFAEAVSEAWRVGQAQDFVSSKMDPIADKVRAGEALTAKDYEDMASYQALQRERVTPDFWQSWVTTPTTMIRGSLLPMFRTGVKAGSVSALGGAAAGSVVPGAGTVAGGVLGAKVGFTTGSVAQAFKMERNELLLELLLFEENGQRIDPDVAYSAAFYYGTTASLLENVGALASLVSGKAGAMRVLKQAARERIISRTGAVLVKEAGKRVAIGAVGEGITEGAQDTAQQLIQARAIESQGFTADPFSGIRAAQAAFQGFQGGGGISVATATATSPVLVAEHRQAQMNEAVLTSIGDSAKLSKLAERSPKLFARAMRNVSHARGLDVQDVTLDREGVQQFFQEVGTTLEEVADQAPAFAEAVQNSEDTGEIVMSLPDFAAEFGRSKLFDGVKMHALIGDAVKTPAQAEAFFEQQYAKALEDGKQAISQLEETEVDQFEAERILVKEEIRAKMLASIEGTKIASRQVNDAAEAASWQLSTVAQRAHKTPLQIWNQTSRVWLGPNGQRLTQNGDGFVDQDGIEYDQTGRIVPGERMEALFADTVVRDEDTGELQAQYHWTHSEEQFDIFRPFSHFGTAQAAADRQSLKRGNNPGLAEGRTLEVFINLRNVVELDEDVSGPFDTPTQVLDALLESGDISQDQINAMETEVYLRHNFEDSPAFREDLMLATAEMLESLGIDGIKYLNSIEDPGSFSYLVFNPEGKVKATTNESPTDGPSIFEQPAHAATTFHFDATPEQFHAAIHRAKARNRHGAAVEAKDLEGYASPGTQLFLTDDESAGFAITDDGDIVSLFKADDSPHRGVAGQSLQLALHSGGIKLDAFDTVLPHLYGRQGFRAVARVKFDPEFAPPDWDYDTFREYNDGKPDIVFMVYDPTAGPYRPGDGPIVDFEAAEALQKEAVERTRTMLQNRHSHQIPTRLPSGKKAVDSDLPVGLQIGRQARANFETVAEAVVRQGTDPRKGKTGKINLGFAALSEIADPDQRAEAYIEQVKDNLLYLHDQFEAEHPGINERARKWYDGGHRLVQTLARRYGVPDATVAAIVAALSPQKPWFENMSLAERTLDIYFTRQDHVPDEKMVSTALRLFDRAPTGKDEKAIAKSRARIKKNLDMVRLIMANRLSDLTLPAEKAMWIRVYDEAHNPRPHKTVTPEGDILLEDFDRNTKWNPLLYIARAVSAIENPSVHNLSALMGKAHKIRNFYNNLLVPNSDLGEVTIDTHAVAAGHLRPFGGSSYEVNLNLSGPSDVNYGVVGSYGLHAEAYRRAAQERNVLPREMQSITWEAVRGLFTTGFKQSAKVDLIDQIWEEYDGGEISIEEARRRVRDTAGGIDATAWAGSSVGDADQVRASTYDRELAGPGRPGRAQPGRPGPGDGSDTAGELSQPAGSDVLRKGGITGIIAAGWRAGDPVVTRLSQAADATTLHHEMAHLVLDAIQREAEQPAASPEIRAMWKDLTNWFGTTNIGERQHEMYASANEAYLLRGKAPSAQLEGTFRRIKTIFGEIYASIRAVLMANARKNGHMTDAKFQQAISIFDRLYATDRQINALAEQRHMPLAFSSAEEAGMTEGEWRQFTAERGQVMEAAKERLLAKALKKVQARYSKEARAARQDLREKIRAEMALDPAWAAEQWLRRGVNDADLPMGERIKLSRDQVRDRFPLVADQLGPYVGVKRGVSLDTAAAQLGFAGGDELVQALLALPNRKQYVEAMAEAELARQNPDLFDEGRMVEEAEREAFGGLDLAELTARELTALAQRRQRPQQSAAARQAAEFPTTAEQDQQAVAQARENLSFATTPQEAADAAAELELALERQRAGRLLRRAERTKSAALRQSKVEQKAVDAAARALVLGTRVRDLRPQRWLAMARRAADKSRQAVARGDLEAAVAAKRQQLLGQLAFRHAVDLRDKVKDVVRWQRRYDSKPLRRILEKAKQVSGADHLARIEQVRASMDWTAMSQARIDELQSLSEYRDALRAAGEDLALPEDVQAKVEAAASNYKNRTVGDVLNAEMAMRSIENVARRWDKVGQAQEARTLQQAEDQLVAAAEASGLTVSKTDAEGLARNMASQVNAWLLKPEALWIQLDGGAADGAWHSLMFRPMNESQDAETHFKRLYHARVKEIYGVYSKAERAAWYKKDIELSTGERISKHQLLAIALNLGNRVNRNAVMSGLRQQFGIQEAEVLRLIDTQLEQRDMEVTQKIWDLLETLQKPVFDLQEKLTGIRPEKVEADEFETAHGTWAGGYYPIAYDPKHRDSQLNEAQNARLQEIGQGNFALAMTQADFVPTYLRQRTSDGKLAIPLDLDLSVGVQHMNEVIHDLAFRENLIGVSKLLRRPAVKDAIRNRYSDEMYRMTLQWLGQVAIDTRTMIRKNSPFENWASWGRVVLTYGAMGYKISTALAQFLGFSTSVDEVGSRYMARAMGRWMRNPVETMQQVAEQSEFIRDRASALDTEVSHARRNLAKDKPRRTQFLQDHAFDIMILTDGLVSRITWMAAYDRAMDGNVDGIAAGDVQAAKRYGDQSVRLTQSGSHTKDLAQVQRTNELLKLLTPFYSYFSVVYARWANHVSGNKTKAQTFSNVMKGLMWMIVMPSLLRGVGGEGWDALWDDDEDLDEEWAHAVSQGVLEEMYSNLTAPFPILRGYNPTRSSAMVDRIPGLKPFEDIAGGGEELVEAATELVEDGELDIEKRDFMNVMVATMHLTRTPGAAQAKVSLGAFIDFLNGDEPHAGEFLLRKGDR